MKTFTISLDLGIITNPFDRQEIIKKYKDRPEGIAKAALVICANHDSSIFKKQTTSNFITILDIIFHTIIRDTPNYMATRPSLHHLFLRNIRINGQSVSKLLEGSDISNCEVYFKPVNYLEYQLGIVYDNEPDDIIDRLYKLLFHRT